MAEDKAMFCPFCGWKNNDTAEYQMLLHLETLHAEGDSPFVARAEDNAADSTGTSGDDLDPRYAECPVEGCGELLLLETLDYHLELHAEESTEQFEEPSAPAAEEPEASAAAPAPLAFGHARAHREAERQHRRPDHGIEKHDRQAKAISAWKRLLKMPGSSSAHKLLPLKRQPDGVKTDAAHPARGKRLGKADLGKYAHEERMPEWLMSLLKKEGQVTSQWVVPVLAQLLDQSTSTNYAYLCHPCVHHVSKLKREGGFCGYRNIQMLCSYITHTKSKGSEYLMGPFPSIFDIQDIIEAAWDRGINAQGRLETGGIRGTRKYIGTSEALALCRALEIPCDAQGIRHESQAKSEALLMDHVEHYFQSGVGDPTERIRITELPPLYFQHAGHSLTIIGFEKLTNGTKNLVVFDPSFHDSSSITRLVGQAVVHPAPAMALRPYRRGTRYLKAYREFEILRLRTETE